MENQHIYARNHGTPSSKPDSRQIQWQRVLSGREPLELNPILPTTEFGRPPDSPLRQTILLLGSSSHLTILAKPPYPNPHRWLQCKVRAWVYIYNAVRAGDMHKLSPSSAGTMCSSPQRLHLPVLQSTAAQHQQWRKLCQVWFSPAAKQVERHYFHCLQLAARKSHSFPKSSAFFDLLILNRMASYPSTTAYSTTL